MFEQTVWLPVVSQIGTGFSLDQIPTPSPISPTIRFVLRRSVTELDGARRGFGIVVAQKLVDQVIHGQYGNEVLLIKYLDEPQSKTARSFR
jgi:hypothetical protein